MAEMLKCDGSGLRRALLELFNAVFCRGAPTPADWHQNTFKVLFKSGDRAEPKNYRPICVLPVLYKLFSIVLYRRLQPTLERELSRDQAGFRKQFTTTNHLHGFTQIQEKTSEWNVEFIVDLLLGLTQGLRQC